LGRSREGEPKAPTERASFLTKGFSDKPPSEAEVDAKKNQRLLKPRREIKAEWDDLSEQPLD